MLDSSQAQLEVQDEDAIIEAMQSSGLDGQNDSGSEKSKVGQIVVEIRRIRLGLKKYDPNYRPKHEEGKDVDIDMDGVESGITHATGFSYANTLARSPLPTVEYLDYIPGEGLWATFQFFYRSAGMGPARFCKSVVMDITWSKNVSSDLNVFADFALQISYGSLALEVLNLASGQQGLNEL